MRTNGSRNCPVWCYAESRATVMTSRVSRGRRGSLSHPPRGRNSATALRDAAAVYKVDTDAIALKVKEEFAAKAKAQAAKKGVAKGQSKAMKKAKAA
jgi:hypothetical protein